MPQEKDVHDCLQLHFQDLTLIFLAYSRSALGSGTAADAMEMEMAEFKDLVEECMLATREVGFTLMQNQFIKANAVNTGKTHEAHQASRRNAKHKKFDNDVFKEESEQPGHNVEGTTLTIETSGGVVVERKEEAVQDKVG